MEAFVTLVATDSYASGALVIAHRLRELGSKKDRVCLVTSNVSPEVQTILSQVYIVILVETLRSQSINNLELLGRPDLDITFTKMHAWRLVQYKKVVFLDADVFPFQNIDELFDRPSFSAAPDAGWPDCFNSGVFVAEPSNSVYNDLSKLASEEGSFDGGDQGLLNTYFSSWPESPSHRLPFTFNTTPTAQYGYAPAQVQYGHKVNIAHFIGQNKPWKYQRFADGKILPMGSAWEGTKDMVQAWWNTWDKYFGKISPYHLLSGHASRFDSGFQTRPIVSLNEIIENAWENEKIDTSKKVINPMPPVSTITMTQPDWLQEELKQIAEQNNKGFMKPYQKPRQHVSQEQYSMIQWDPAYEEPPNTGSLGADIPDLSSYKNVWDKSAHDQKQHIWVAPVLHPEPEIMKKPEYAHLIEKDREEKKKEQHRIEQEKDISQAHIHTREQVQKESHQDLSYQDHHRHRHQESLSEMSIPNPTEVHTEEHVSKSGAFPWESNPAHFPLPTRIWQDESHQYHAEEQYEEPEESSANLKDTLDGHTKEQEHNTQIETHQQGEHQQKDDDEVVDKYDTVRYISEEIEVEEQPRSEPKINKTKIEKTIKLPEPPIVNESTGLFAIDEPLTPSVQSRIGEFIATLHYEEDHDFSDRDLIPINFKASSRLQSGTYTPSPLISRNASRAGSRSGSRPGSRPGSRRSSVASSRRNSLPGSAQKRPDITMQPLADVEQSAKLFASDKVSAFNQKTPYTSAAVTPAYVASPALETTEYFNEAIFADEEGFYQPSSYCLNDSLDLVYQTGSPKIWNPMDALTRLKSQSESMVLKQSLTEALNKAAKEQEELEKLEALGSAKKTFKSVWNVDDDEWPNIASGNSSPRTPIIRDMNSNLSLEIEHEKERYRQQRESLKITEPHNAVATLLEAELDLSSGSLFKRRNFDSKSSNNLPSQLKQPQIKKVQQQSKPFVQLQAKEPVEEFQPSYFSDDIIKEAQKRFNSLRYDQDQTQMDETLAFPTGESSSAPMSESTSHKHQTSSGYTFESKSYLPNFGFNKQHKLKIYKTGLIEPEVLATMNNVSEIEENPISSAETAEKAIEVELKNNTSTKGEAVEDCEHEELQTKTTLADEGWVRIAYEGAQKAPLDLCQSSIIEEMIISDTENIEETFRNLKESATDTQTKKDTSVTRETEIRHLDVTKNKESTTESQEENHVVMNKEISKTVEDEPPQQSIEQKKTDELKEQNTSNKETLLEAQITVEREEKIPPSETEHCHKENHLTNTDDSKEKLEEVEDDKMTEEELLREILDGKEKEQSSLEIEEVDTSEYLSNVHFGIEVFEVDNETQELTFQSEGVVDVVDQESLEIEEDEYQETETSFYKHHMETLEIDEDGLEMESADEELVLETIDLEEEEEDTEVVVPDPKDILEVDVDLSGQNQETHLHISVDEKITEIAERNEESLDTKSVEKVALHVSVEDDVQGLSQETYTRYVSQEPEAGTVRIEKEIIHTEERDSQSHKDTKDQGLEAKDTLTAETTNPHVNVDVVEIKADISASTPEIAEVDIQSTSSKNNSKATLSQSRSANLDTISEDSVSEFKALGSFLEKRSMSLEPMKVIHEFTENDIGLMEGESFTFYTTSEPQTMDYSESTEERSKLSKAFGSSRSYSATRSMSFTEGSQGRPSMPTRKLSITESLLSSRFSSSSITTTSVLVEAFDKHGDTSSTKSGIMSRVRSNTNSKAPSTASIDTSSISSFTRPSNANSKNLFSP
ncbi:hypothetical protein BY458DRAFT_499542 [Sporodiniella umbellata]|nr:hypothetical protein BY458DRAFT_499542 [Sporodiniella umbellata]